MRDSSAIQAGALPAEFDGDLRELMQALGALGDAPGWPGMLARVGHRGEGDLRALEQFLTGYVEGIHGAIELPAVLKAWGLAEQGFSRELIELDRELSRADGLKPFRAASCAVGRRQLSKLRRLRDSRVVQRYLRAVEDGRAAGWHVVVYGVVLSVYSVPLRTGLNHLATQTIGGMALSAAASLNLPLAQCDELAMNIASRIPAIVNQCLEKADSVEAVGGLIAFRKGC